MDALSGGVPWEEEVRPCAYYRALARTPTEDDAIVEEWRRHQRRCRPCQDYWTEDLARVPFPRVRRRARRNSHSDLEAEAIRIFGTTDDPYDAGFVLRDGTILDFQRCRGEKGWIEHEDVLRAYPPSEQERIAVEEDSEPLYMPFLRDTGAARIGLYAGGAMRWTTRLPGAGRGVIAAEAVEPATRAQKAMLREFAMLHSPEELSSSGVGGFYRGEALRDWLRVL